MIEASRSRGIDVSDLFGGAKVATQPSSPVEVMQACISTFYAGYSVELDETGVFYMETSILFEFVCDTDMYSSRGSQANDAARRELTASIGRRVTVGGDRYCVKVWVAK